MEKLYSLLSYMSPYVRRAWDGILPVDWRLPERIILDFEFVYIMEGQTIVMIDGNEYMGEPGDLFLFRPLKVHSMHAINNCHLRQPHIHFDFNYREDSEEVYIPVWNITEKDVDPSLVREDITGPGWLNIPDKITLKDRTRCEELLFKIIKEEDSISLYSILYKKAMMLEFIAFVLEEVRNLDESIDNFMDLDGDILKHLEAARNFITKNTNKSISLDEIAAISGFSKNYFTKLFKSLYGMTPIQFHSNERMEKAKQLLTFSSDNITEISYKLGFESIHQFSKTFKQSTGTAPMHFRQITTSK